MTLLFQNILNSNLANRHWTIHWKVQSYQKDTNFWSLQNLINCTISVEIFSTENVQVLNWYIFIYADNKVFCIIRKSIPLLWSLVDLINDDMGHSLEVRVSLQSPQDDPRGTEQQSCQRGLEQRNTDTPYKINLWNTSSIKNKQNLWCCKKGNILSYMKGL